MRKTASILLKTSPRTLKQVLDNVDPRLARVFLPWAFKNGLTALHVITGDYDRGY